MERLRPEFIDYEYIKFWIGLANYKNAIKYNRVYQLRWDKCLYSYDNQKIVDKLLEVIKK